MTLNRDRTPDSERIETRLRRLAAAADVSVYQRFIDEMDAVVIRADEPVAAVVGRLTRAVKRAQMVNDGELKSPSERGWGEKAPMDSKEQPAVHIAALSPSVVLRLVDVVEAARRMKRLYGYPLIEQGQEIRPINRVHMDLYDTLAALDAASEPQSERTEEQR